MIGFKIKLTEAGTSPDPITPMACPVDQEIGPPRVASEAGRRYQRVEDYQLSAPEHGAHLHWLWNSSRTCAATLAALQAVLHVQPIPPSVG